jgi:hypothetical protein
MVGEIVGVVMVNQEADVAIGEHSVSSFNLLICIFQGTHYIMSFSDLKGNAHISGLNSFSFST